MGHAIDSVAPILGAVLGSVLLPGVGTALGASIGAGGGAAIGGGLTSGALNYSKTHNFGSALKAGALSGAGSYVGGNIGNGLLGDSLGTVGGTTLGNGASSDIAGALGAGAGRVLSAPLSGVLGSYAGNSIASGFAPQGQPSMAGNYPYAPTQANAAAAPKSLNSMSSLTGNQQASSLATQGVYGGGNGPDEQGYYANLLNRQLTTGGLQPLSSLSPIEQSYNNKLGFGGATDTTSLLGALNKWQPNYA